MAFCKYRNLCYSEQKQFVLDEQWRSKQLVWTHHETYPSTLIKSKLHLEAWRREGPLQASREGNFAREIWRPVTLKFSLAGKYPSSSSGSCTSHLDRQGFTWRDQVLNRIKPTPAIKSQIEPPELLLFLKKRKRFSNLYLLFGSERHI